MQGQNANSHTTCKLAGTGKKDNNYNDCHNRKQDDNYNTRHCR